MTKRAPAFAALTVAALTLMTGCSSSVSVGSESADQSPPPVSSEWQCEEIPESPDGKYDVVGAGRVSISPDGKSLSPVGAAAGDEYGNAEARLYDSSAEVEFRHRTDGTRVLFRADVRDEGRKIQVCRD
jgi:hypothetical protein